MKPYKLEIQNVLALLFALLTLNCGAVTPFFIQGFSHDGAPQTNQIFMTQYPQTSAPFTIYGTNIIYGANAVVITPNTAGYALSSSYPGTYRFYITNLNVSFIANIPDTAVTNSLALYVTNLVSFSAPGLSSYGVVTNLTGFPPATNSTAGIESALGYVPATNTNPGIIFALGFTPATNNYNGMTNSLGFAPATNSFAGSTNALGYMPATNSNSGIVFALGFTPATNNYNGMTNSLGFAPATNSSSGIISALQFTPRTNDGYVGVSALAGVANIVTNGGVVWVFYKTNGLPGPAFTNEPVGSLMTTSNGGFYSLSNLIWNAH